MTNSSGTTTYTVNAGGDERTRVTRVIWSNVDSNGSLEDTRNSDAGISLDSVVLSATLPVVIIEQGHLTLNPLITVVSITRRYFGQ